MEVACPWEEPKEEPKGTGPESCILMASYGNKRVIFEFCGHQTTQPHSDDHRLRLEDFNTAFYGFPGNSAPLQGNTHGLEDQEDQDQEDCPSSNIQTVPNSPRAQTSEDGGTLDSGRDTHADSHKRSYDPEDASEVEAKRLRSLPWPEWRMEERNIEIKLRSFLD
jgi:hypothetical protein